MNHNEWLEKITQGDSLRRIAEVADVSDRTLSRQLREEEIRPDMVIKIAQSYGESPSEALVDLGFMDEKWLVSASVRRALMKASDEELTDELLRRLHLLSDKEVDDLAERRRQDTMSDGHGSIPLSAVADSSPDEDALREDGDWTDPDYIP